MKDKIQYEKATKKIELLEKHILGLLSYNSIVDYYNIKRFDIKVNYFYEDIEKCYYYDINIFRGTNEPKKTFNTSLQYKEKINDLIEKLIKKLINDTNFSNFSLSKIDSLAHKEFVLRMKNDVNIHFSIMDDEDYEFYSSIVKNNQKNTVITSKEKKEYSSEIKDIVQQEKAKKVLDNINDIFSKYCEINSIENYMNKKPIKLLIELDNNFKDDCNIFRFQIIRGNINPEIVMDYKLSLKDSDIVYNKFQSLIEEYSNSDIYTYTGQQVVNDKSKYTLYLKNMLYIEFNYYKESDKKFFNNIFINKSNTLKNVKKLEKVKL